MYKVKLFILVEKFCLQVRIMFAMLSSNADLWSWWDIFQVLVQ